VFEALVGDVVPHLLQVLVRGGLLLRGVVVAGGGGAGWGFGLWLWGIVRGGVFVIR
jgi:hypothetical protein